MVENNTFHCIIWYEGFSKRFFAREENDFIVFSPYGYFKTEHSAKKVIDNCEKYLKILWDIN